MDLIKCKSVITHWVGKYKYVLVVLLVGIVLMTVPDRTEVKNEILTGARSNESATENMEDKLAGILSHISGAGTVEVMLTVAQGECIIYQTDSTYSQSDGNMDSRTETILITDSDRNESGLVHQKNPPIYQGAIILAQGAEDSRIKLAIVEAVMDITGLGADRISVLKMR